MNKENIATKRAALHSFTLGNSGLNFFECVVEVTFPLEKSMSNLIKTL